MKKIILGAVLAAAMATGLAAGASPAAAVGPGSGVAASSVILVPGWSFSGIFYDPHGFDQLEAALTADGHAVYRARFFTDDNIVDAQEIARIAVRAWAEHPHSRIDLVAHSMGGYAARYYLKFLGGLTRATHYVSLGTPDYGTPTACWLPPTLGGDGCPSSPLLATLNNGDDTPGNVYYTTLSSTQDDSAANSSRPLDGGVCVKNNIPGTHDGEPNNPVFIGLIRQALAGKCPGQFVSLPIA